METKFERDFSSKIKESVDPIFKNSRIVFFRLTTELTLHVPLFGAEVNRFRGNPVIAGSSPCFSQKLLRPFAKADEAKRPLSIVLIFFIIPLLQISALRDFSR